MADGEGDLDGPPCVDNARLRPQDFCRRCALARLAGEAICAFYAGSCGRIMMPPTNT